MSRYLLVVAMLLLLSATTSAVAQTEEQKMVDALQKFAFPVGVVLPFAGVDTPLVRQSLYEDGWFFADGCHLDEKQFFSLWLLLRDKYGAAPAGRFRLPDLRGRIPLGAGTGAGLTSRSLGQAVGEESHALVGAEMPDHKHKVAGRTSSVAETHSYYPARALPATDGDDHSHNVDVVSGGSQNHSTGSPHNVVQPSLVVNYIVFYGKYSKVPKALGDACSP